MFTKNDCLKLLFDLQNTKGINVDAEVKYLLTHAEPSLDIIEKINNNMDLNIRLFYEKLRKSYNNKKSKLYINIVKGEWDDPKEVLCTLASLQLQILLFNKDIDDPAFLRSARFSEISDCLKRYYDTREIVPCQVLLELFKADLKFLENKEF